MDAFLERFNIDFVKKKLSVLNSNVLILRNFEKNFLEISSKILEEISEKRFDILFCKNEEEVKF